MVLFRDPEGVQYSVDAELIKLRRHTFHRRGKKFVVCLPPWCTVTTVRSNGLTVVAVNGRVVHAEG